MALNSLLFGGSIANRRPLGLVMPLLVQTLSCLEGAWLSCLEGASSLSSSCGSQTEKNPSSLILFHYSLPSVNPKEKSFEYIRKRNPSSTFMNLLLASVIVVLLYAILPVGRYLKSVLFLFVGLVICRRVST